MSLLAAIDRYYLGLRLLSRLNEVPDAEEEAPGWLEHWLPVENSHDEVRCGQCGSRIETIELTRMFAPEPVGTCESCWCPDLTDSLRAETVYGCICACHLIADGVYAADNHNDFPSHAEYYGDKDY